MEVERYGRGIAGRVTDHQFGSTANGSSGLLR